MIFAKDFCLSFLSFFFSLNNQTQKLRTPGCSLDKFNSLKRKKKNKESKHTEASFCPAAEHSPPNTIPHMLCVPRCPILPQNRSLANRTEAAAHLNTDALMPAGSPLGNFTCSWFRISCPVGLIHAKEQNLMAIAVLGSQAVISTYGSELGAWSAGDENCPKATSYAPTGEWAVKQGSKEKVPYLWKSNFQLSCFYDHFYCIG